MKLVFIGSGAFAVDSLQQLCKEGFSVPLVISQPDRRAGRGRDLSPTALKQAALDLGLPCECPEKIREPEVLDRIRSLEPQALLVAAYGQKIPRPLLDVPRLASVNVHGSLLPYHRGASPIAGCLLAGDKVTGVTLQIMADEIDAGDIITQKTLDITDDDNAATLEAKLARLGAELLPPTLRGLDDGSLIPRPQDHSKATHTKKLKKNQGKIPFHEATDKVLCHIRAYTPWPGAFATLTSGKDQTSKIIITGATLDREAEQAEKRLDPGTIHRVDGSGFSIRCGDGSMRVLSVQRPGKKAMPADAFLRGFTFAPEDRLLGATS